MPQAVRDYEIQEVGDDEVDYELPSANALTGSHANLIPIPGNVQSTRVFYGARFFNQSLPVVGGEAPLVQSLIDNDADGRSFDDHYGERAGAVRADDDYEVLEVLRDRLRLKNSRNEVVEKELYDELPFNRKSMITQRPLVKPGDKVSRGAALAASNYTDDNGTLAMGLNARIGIVPYKGYSMDDAVVIRQGFADRLRSQTTETFKQDRDEQTIVGRNHFHSLFPDKFTKDQLSLVDADGVIKPGTIVQPGDPLILTTRPRVLSSTSGELGKLSKTMRQVRSDASQVWEGDGPARVMKVAKTKKGVKVVVLQERGTKEGDKITLRHGQKGTVSLILPDDHMPRTTDGEPLDMMLNPQGMPSRANFSTLYELLLGKVAKKKGAPIKLPMFLPPGVEMYDYVEQQLKEAGLTDVEEVFDPQDNRKLENPIAVGMGFIQKLHHTSASKADARGQGSYDLNQQPAKGGEGGAKRLSGLETHALMSSGAYATLREGATLRGQKNDDYWRMLRAGHTPRDPDEPFVWKKFRGLMAGAGLRMRDEAGGKNRLGPMTDDDVDAYKPLEVRNGRTLDLRTLEPEKGGLFDQALVGNNMWGKVTLPEPVLNPAFEGPARHLLGLKLKDLQAILAGEMELPEEMQRRIAERVRLMTKDAGWAQSLGSALSSRTGRLVRNTAAGTAAGGALGAGAAMVKTDTVPEIQSKGRVTSYDGTFGSPAAVKPLGFLDWFKDPATFAEYSKKYVGHYTPRQFMGGYGEQLDSEIGKAKAYQDRLRQQPGGEQFPALDYSQIDTAVPVLAHEDGAVDDSMFEQYNDGTRQVRVSDGSKPLSPLSARINRTTPEELSPANVLTHEMRHAWQAAAPGTEHPPILPQYSTLEKQDQPHGLRTSEQLGWLGGLQHELFKQRGSRMETPEEARALIQQAVSSEPEFLQQYPIENTEVLRGIRWLKYLKQQSTDNYRGETERAAAAQQYEQMLEWLSRFAPAVVGADRPDEQAIKMGSVRPAFYDPDFKTEPTPAFNVPKTGPDAIHLALAALDLDELEKTQKDLVASGKVSKRNGAIQTLNAISGLRANNVRPEQLMITKVPVVPPAFRPFALVGETFIPGDANELYKDLFDLKETLAEAKQNFGDEGAVAERRAFQAAVKAVYGYGDPVNPKSQQRGVSGFLRQISGSNPKFSFFQRKLISKTQDQVGRGVITPDPELTLDEIGIPEDMAWEMYGTYIMRRLVRDGMQRAEALRQIKDRSKFARQALEKELPERPVVYSRSPAWHKYNIISGTPRLIEGDTIRISPFVAAGLGADYDGDTVNLHVPASPDAVREAKEILRPSNMLFSIKDDEKVVPKLVQEQILGPYAASQRPSKAVHTFPDRESALKAIRTGQISLSDEIEFPDIPVKAKVAATLEAMRNRC